MDCCICTTMPCILRPPRNTICGTCFEGARSIIASLNKLQINSDKAISDHKPNNSLQLSLSNSCKASSSFCISLFSINIYFASFKFFLLDIFASFIVVLIFGCSKLIFSISVEVTQRLTGWIIFVVC